jgi:hypothetical protein
VPGTGARIRKLAGPVTGKGAGVPAPFPVTPAFAVPLCAPVIFSPGAVSSPFRGAGGGCAPGRGVGPAEVTLPGKAKGRPVTARETLSAFFRQWQRGVGPAMAAVTTKAERPPPLRREVAEGKEGDHHGQTACEPERALRPADTAKWRRLREYTRRAQRNGAGGCHREGRGRARALHGDRPRQYPVCAPGPGTGAVSSCAVFVGGDPLSPTLPRPPPAARKP